MIESLHGVLSSVPAWEGVLLFGLVALVMVWAGAEFPAWVLLAALGLFAWGTPPWTWAVLAGVVIVVGVPPVRRVLSGMLLRSLVSRGKLPTLSRTEREAVEAGGIGLEADLLAGSRDLVALARADMPGLASEERAFLDGPVREVCDSVDTWDAHRRRDLTPGTWSLLARHRLFALAIPREYGGHGFSASATSALLVRTASADPVLAGVVSAANTFSAADLLLRFGTEAQKRRWLPELARHREIAALALGDRGAAVEPGAVTARGEVFRRDDGGLGLRISWDKCFVALGPIATVLVVVFRLRDARDLLGKGPDPGITCALVPVSLPGVRAALRHDVAGLPFPSGTSTGEDVQVDLEESVLGGMQGVGTGWRMLADGLAGGWGLATVSIATGRVKHLARIASAHGVAAAGFGSAGGRFDATDEPLARIAGRAYALEAARRFTCGALEAGVRSGLLGAVVSRWALEAERAALADAFAVLGPTGMALGPDHALALAQQATALSVPAPGSGIRASAEVVAGLAALRGHPFLAHEMDAIEAGDLRAFDRLVRDHLGHVVGNGVRAKMLGLTRGALAGSPVDGPSARYWRRLAWASASTAFWLDVALVSQGGRLRRNETLVRLLADLCSAPVMTALVLRRYDADGRRPEDLPFLQWSARETLATAQSAFEEFFDTLVLPGWTWLLRGPMAAWVRVNRLSPRYAPTAAARLAGAVRTAGPHRERHLGGVHVASRSAARLEKALALAQEAEPVHAALREAVRVGRVPRTTPALMLESALAAGVLTRVEVERVLRAEEAREEATRIPAFAPADFFATAVPKPKARRQTAPKPVAAPPPKPESKPSGRKTKKAPGPGSKRPEGGRRRRGDG